MLQVKPVFVSTLLVAALLASCAPVNVMVAPGTSGATPKTSASAAPSGGQTPASSSPGVAGATVEKEPNNDFPESSVLVLGATVGANAASSDDYFKVSIPAGKQDGVLKLRLVETDGEFTPVVSLYGDKKQYLSSFSAPDATASPLEGELHVAAGRDYYIKVEGRPDLSPAYSLRAEYELVADPGERNNEFTQAIPLTLGKATPFTIFGGADQDADIDFFAISLPSGKNTLRLVVKNKSSVAEAQTLNFELYDAAKVYLASISGENAQADINDVFDGLSAGQYYLKAYSGVSGRVLSDLTVTAE